MTPEQIGKALRRTRELIAGGHWTQGYYQTAVPLRYTSSSGSQHYVDDRDVKPGETCFCIAGAVDYVLVHEMGKPRGTVRAGGSYTWAVMEALSKHLPEKAQKPNYSVVANVINYNDKPGRTEADMLALLDRAIADYPQ